MPDLCTKLSKYITSPLGKFERPFPLQNILDASLSVVALTEFTGDVITLAHPAIIYTQINKPTLYKK